MLLTALLSALLAAAVDGRAEPCADSLFDGPVDANDVLRNRGGECWSWNEADCGPGFWQVDEYRDTSSCSAGGYIDETLCIALDGDTCDWFYARASSNARFKTDAPEGIAPVGTCQADDFWSYRSYRHSCTECTSSSQGCEVPGSSPKVFDYGSPTPEPTYEWENNCDSWTQDDIDMYVARLMIGSFVGVGVGVVLIILASLPVCCGVCRQNGKTLGTMGIVFGIIVCFVPLITQFASCGALVDDICSNCDCGSSRDTLMNACQGVGIFYAYIFAFGWAAIAAGTTASGIGCAVHCGCGQMKPHSQFIIDGAPPPAGNAQMTTFGGPPGGPPPPASM